jgi:hypothetical protein
LYDPLIPPHPRVEETLLDETLHVRMADIGARLSSIGGQRWRRED